MRVDKVLPRTKKHDAELAAHLGILRMRKSPDELRVLQAATKKTKRAFEDLILSMRTASSERELEAAFDARARIEGAGVGYGTIVAAGKNACVLHWTQNNAKLRKQDLLLVDAGVETELLYTADITRTLPLRGKFSATQRVLYDIVIAAQAAAFRAVKPGNDFLEPHRAASRVLARGLEDLGILESAERSLEKGDLSYKRYTLHGTSHMLGMDVHDCANVPRDIYYGKLKPGMVLTIEPGLYFQPDDLTVPKKYRGIGIRVEDDVAVTKTGRRILSASIPRRADDVEAWIKAVWRRKR